MGDDKIPQQIIKHANDPITVKVSWLRGSFTASVNLILSAGFPPCRVFISAPVSKRWAGYF